MAAGPKPEPLDKCFIITPIGDNQSNARRATDGISKVVIEPILKEFNMEPIAAHEISEQGSINDQVIKHIYNDKLAIVNLTGLNSNVMYELGVRYTMRKQTILICEEGTKLPFDIIAERTIFYKNDIAGSLELMKNLRSTISSIDFKSEPNNPIFKVLDFDSAMGEIKKENGTDALVERLQSLIENNNSNNSNKHQPEEIYLTLSKIDGSTFTDEEYKNFPLQILDVVHSIYPSSGVINHKRNLILFKFNLTISYNLAVTIMQDFINDYFIGSVEVLFL